MAPDPAPLAPPPRPAEAFPTLDAAQLERVRSVGTERAFHAGEILFDQGEIATRFFVVIEGSIEIVHPDAAGEHLITVHEPGSFTGEFDVLTGSRTLVRGRARSAGRVLELDLHPARAQGARGVTRSRGPAGAVGVQSASPRNAGLFSLRAIVFERGATGCR